MRRIQVIGLLGFVSQSRVRVATSHLQVELH